MPETQETSDTTPDATRLTADIACSRLDVFLSNSIDGLSRAAAARLTRESHVTVNGTMCKPSQRINVGDTVTVLFPPTASATPQGEQSTLNIIFENDAVLVIDKPAGMVVHPSPGHDAHTLVNALLGRYPQLQCGEALRPGIVHRLDKDTSGLLLVAKDESARQYLMQQFKEGRVHKEYVALVVGRTAQSGTIDEPIGRHPVHRKKMAVVSTGREARTHYTVCEYIGEFSLLNVVLETGRTHQIRVHFDHIGHGVAGDRTYGGKNSRRALSGVLARQFLHAHTLTLLLPGEREPRTFISDLPNDLIASLAEARRLAQD
ncbi:MAG: RluA family pseudouridine synthase [Dehalococcoidia bacterium]|nr:RluA family pseudouridine synthase [Dehalococcoidia bacterium]